MAEGSEPSDDSGVRRRRSVEQDESSREGIVNENYNAPTGVRTITSDGEPVIQTTATDLPPGTRPVSAGEFERVRVSRDLERRPPIKKRKSDEISRDTESAGGKNEARQPLSVDTRIANQIHVSQENNGAKNGSGTPPASDSPAPSSPLSPRSRNRGMSLRTSLFTRNVERKSPTSPSHIEMQRVESFSDKGSRPQTAKSDFRTSITVSPVLERSESDVSERVPKHGPIRLKSPEQSRTPSRRGFQGISALPNYQRWVTERANRHLPIKRCKDAYQRAHKFILQIQEIPPSKDGRHIPLDPSRKKALIDERTGHPYMSNTIKSSK